MAASCQLLLSLHGANQGYAGKAGFTPDAYWSFLTWYKHTAAQDYNSKIIWTQGGSFAVDVGVEGSDSYASLKFYHDGTNYSDNAFALVDATWYYILVRTDPSNAQNIQCYAAAMDGTQAAIVGHRNPGGNTRPTAFWIGGLDSANAVNSAYGSYKYGRLWIGPSNTAVIRVAADGGTNEMLTEQSNTTPQKGSPTAGWAWADYSTTTDQTGNGNSCVFGGALSGQTGSTEPTLPSTSANPLVVVTANPSRAVMQASNW